MTWNEGMVVVECTVCGWRSAPVGAHSGLVGWLETTHLDGVHRTRIELVEGGLTVKIKAVKCDACDHIDIPADDAENPAGWLLVDVHVEGVGSEGANVYCSWACLADVAQNRAVTPKTRRRRRTKAEMLEAAAANVI
jgi:hypothetical protein